MSIIFSWEPDLFVHFLSLVPNPEKGFYLMDRIYYLLCAQSSREISATVRMFGFYTGILYQKDILFSQRMEVESEKTESSGLKAEVRSLRGKENWTHKMGRKDET